MVDCARYLELYLGWPELLQEHTGIAITLITGSYLRVVQPLNKLKFA